MIYCYLDANIICMKNREIKKTEPILSIQNLKIDIKRASGSKRILNGLSLDIPRGQTTALMGESGSGKTLAAFSILNILPGVANITGGKIMFKEINLLSAAPKKLRQIRGNKIAMIFQEPGTALNPLMPVGRQIGETLEIHQKLKPGIIKEQVLALMDLVGIPDSKRRYRGYPHQMSQGVNQRVVIAMALACRPDILLADEPTSALDPTIQLQIIDLLSKLIKDLKMSVLLISHNVGVVAALADYVAILHDGQIIEQGPVNEIFKNPFHPYTSSFLDATHEKYTKSENNNKFIASSVVSYQVDKNMHCPYINQCKKATKICRTTTPQMVSVTSNHKVRCLLAPDVQKEARKKTKEKNE
jgi:oligopeptide/dipeptide ABC transporter ATP-binding protein